MRLCSFWILKNRVGYGIMKQAAPQVCLRTQVRSYQSKLSRVDMLLKTFVSVIQLKNQVPFNTKSNYKSYVFQKTKNIALF